MGARVAQPVWPFAALSGVMSSSPRSCFRGEMAVPTSEGGDGVGVMDTARATQDGLTIVGCYPRGGQAHAGRAVPTASRGGWARCGVLSGCPEGFSFVEKWLANQYGFG